MFEAGEGTFARCSQPGVFPVVLLVVLGKFVVAVDGSSAAMPPAFGREVPPVSGDQGKEHCDHDRKIE